MSDLDRQLESAYAAQQKNREKLERSVDELRQVAAEGQATGSQVRRLVQVIALVVFLVISVVMLADPRARAWYYLLLFVVVTGGLWSMFRRR